MDRAADDTLQLLRRWHRGEDHALQELLARHLEWVRRFVHDRLGNGLRQKAETLDMVQEAMLRLLRYGPRFEVADTAQFRALVARIVENTIRDEVRRMQRQLRDVAREHRMSTDTILCLDGAGQVTRPSQAASRDEHKAWVQLAIEFLDAPDREVILLREWEGLDFPAVAERLGIGVEAAKKRFQRALPRLHRKMVELRAGGLGRLLSDP